MFKLLKFLLQIYLLLLFYVLLTLHRSIGSLTGFVYVSENIVVKRVMRKWKLEMKLDRKFAWVVQNINLPVFNSSWFSARSSHRCIQLSSIYRAIRTQAQYPNPLMYLIFLKSQSSNYFILYSHSFLLRNFHNLICSSLTTWYIYGWHIYGYRIPHILQCILNMPYYGINGGFSCGWYLCTSTSTDKKLAC